MKMLLNKLWRVTLTTIATKESTSELFAYNSRAYKRFEELKDLHNLPEDSFRTTYDADHDEEIFSNDKVVLSLDYIPDSVNLSNDDICYSR